MKLKRLLIATSLLLTSVILPVHAADFRQADLMQAYYQALKSDPTFKKAWADWQSAKQNLPIARAAYFTQVAVTGNWQRQFNNLTPPLNFPNSNGYNYNYGVVLSVEQPIFNLPAWNAIKSAKASVKSATATYSSAAQDLMVRTVKSYVAVLQAYDQLRFQLARKRAVYEQLKVARQQFDVGLIAITGVYDARSVYDQAVAQSISDQNSLNDAVERLAEITGIHYMRLRAISKQVPLIKPQPNNINAWADTAERQNYGLIAQGYNVIATRDTLKEQSTSWMPQISFSGQYTNDNQSNVKSGSIIPGTPATGVPTLNTNNVLYGLTVNFPMIQGGLVTANTIQAQYNYLSASDQREFTYRSVISNTRQSFLGVITGISKIKADLQSVISARNALNATKAGYEVGTRTMVDVLDDVTSLYQAQQQYMDDQYTYIIDIIELKFNAGTLNVNDLRAINRWLRRPIKLNLPEKALKSLQSRLRPIRPFPSVPEASRSKKSDRLKAADSMVAAPLISKFAKILPNLNLPAIKATTKMADLPMPKQTQVASVHTQKQLAAKKTAHVQKKQALLPPKKTHTTKQQKLAAAKKTIQVQKQPALLPPKKTHASKQKKLTPPKKTSYSKKQKELMSPKEMHSQKKRIIKVFGNDTQKKAASKKPAVNKKVLIKTVELTQKTHTLVMKDHAAAQLNKNEQIIPLYEGPPANRRALPSPTRS